MKRERAAFKIQIGAERFARLKTHAADLRRVAGARSVFGIEGEKDFRRFAIGARGERDVLAVGRNRRPQSFVRVELDVFEANRETRRRVTTPQP